MATRILWGAAGQPSGEGDTQGRCRICGRTATGLPFDEWVRRTFTDWDKLVPGEILCHACQFSFEEASELLAERVGKEKPQRMRNYSHFVVGGNWVPLSKAYKSQMADILLAGDFAVAIVAQSGQKHLIFRAQPGWVQFEEESFVLDPSAFAVLLLEVERLYTQFSKIEIRTAEYKQYRIRKYGLANWYARERVIGERRGSLLFDLALFLAQKKPKEELYGRDEADGRRSPDGDLANDSGGLQEPLPHEHLATVRGSGEKRGLHEQPGAIRQLTLL